MGCRIHPIELRDLELFSAATAPEEDPPSQLNFQLMVLTRSQMHMRTCVDAELRFVFGWSSEVEQALYGLPLPLTADAEQLREQLADCYRCLLQEGIVRSRREALHIVVLNERWASRVEQIGGQVFRTDDDDNYIYSTSQLGRLEGPSLRRHREMVRAFERANPDFAVTPLTGERIEDARAVIRSWLRIKLERQSENRPDSPDYYRLLRDDFSSAMRALENLETMAIRGRVYYRCGEPVGFISGIPFSDGTFLFLHHKNLAIKGLAEAIYSDFARSLIGEFSYINAAQDLGIPSLRAFKRRLSPARMLETYRAVIPPKILLDPPFAATRGRFSRSPT